jgi:hypothetical protein
MYAVIPCLALGLLAQTEPLAPASAGPVEVPAHSSRWDYPKSITPPAGTQVHFVQKGDTLWDLGSKYLGNPFAWPQIWELNKWVKDPHWIYPGDPLLVDGSRRAVPPQARDEDAAPAEVTELRPDLKRTPKPTLDEYGYTFQDFIQLPYLTKVSAEAHLKAAGAVRVSGRQDRDKALLGDGDIVYLSGGADRGFKTGDRLVITRVFARRFFHPDDTLRRKPMGDLLQQMGVVRITSTFPGQSVAIIERSLDGVHVGEWAVPFAEPPHIITKLRTDITSPVKLQEPLAKLLFIREGRTVASAGDMIIIDQGSKQGLKVGDILLGNRPVELDKAAHGAKSNFYLGQVMVIRTEEATATCRVLRTKEELGRGDLFTR